MYVCEKLDMKNRLNTETYESSAMLPEDRSYLIGNLLAAYTNR